MMLKDAVVFDQDSKPIKARVAICEKCGNDSFFIFKIAGHDHSHAQCSHCDTSYCSNSEECKLKGGVKHEYTQ